MQSIEAGSFLYPFDSNPFNKSRADWLMKYWEWVYSIPISQSPREDSSGMNCGVNQNGSVWFLDSPIGVSKFSTSCSIPEGKAIFVPLLLGICGLVDAEDKSDEGITKCATEGNDGGRVKLIIDDKTQLELLDAVKSKKDYESNRTITDFFKLYSVKDNIYNDPEGLDRKRAEGIFAIIKPLPVGNHLIFFHVNVITPYAEKADDYNYSLDVTYYLKIIKSN